MRIINGKRYLSAREVGARLGVTGRTIYNWLDQREAKPTIRTFLKLHRDPISGYIYFEEEPVAKLQRTFERRKR